MAVAIAYALAIATVGLSVVALAVHAARMGVRRFTGLNDPGTSKSYFLLLLAQAQSSMMVYDDGNDVADSLYTNEEVLDAIEKKFRDTPKFTMQCLLNCPVPERMRDKFSKESRMDARTTGLGSDAPRDTHLKIIDKGRMAYLTQHDYDSMVRPYELVDCLTVAGWALKGVARREMPGLMEEFEKKFQQGEAA